MLLLLSTSRCIAQDSVDVDFTATVRDATCVMSIEPVSNLTVFGSAQSKSYELVVPDIGLDKIVHNDPAAEGRFRFVPTHCNATLTEPEMKITVPGGTWSIGKYVVSDTSIPGHSVGIGAGFKRPNEADDQAMDMLSGYWTHWTHWTDDEIQNGFTMVVFFRDLSNRLNPAQPGIFRAQVIFTFNYK